MVPRRRYAIPLNVLPSTVYIMTVLDRQHALQVGSWCLRISIVLKARAERPQLSSIMATAAARAYQEVIYTGLCKATASSPLIHVARQGIRLIMLTTLAAALSAI